MTDAADLLTVPWFASLEPAARQDLAARGAWRRRRAGEWLYGEGDQETGLVAILQGGVYLYVAVPGGGDVLFGFVGPGGVLGQSVTLGGGPRLVTAICASDCAVFGVSDGGLQRAVEAHPSILRALMTFAYEQQRITLETVATLVGLPPRKRLIARLLTLAGGDGRVPIPQAALAEMIGASRKAVNVWLGELERAGLVTQAYRSIGVVDRARLKRLLE